MIELLDKKTKKSKKYSGPEAMEALYYQRAEVDKKRKGSIRRLLSKVEELVPLYDPYSDNLYLVNKHNVYQRVVHDHYRFPTEDLISEIRHKTGLVSDPVILKRRRHKLDLMLDFLSNFELDTLYDTYIRVFYHYSKEAGKNLTTCKRPSFIAQYKHIEPFYSRDEIINMGLNMGLIKPDNEYLEKEVIEKLCKKVQRNDISSDVILEHHEYIASNNGIGMVQYYTLHGSFFMNMYLRKLMGNNNQDKFLETNINEVWKLIKNSPAFDREYTVYRFIHDDKHLKHLKAGDIYREDSFISTTRDPFYRADEFSFGFVLIKIKIPKDVIGVGLCLETFSHFQDEEEILLPPRSVMRLDKKDKNCTYYHIDNNFESKIETRYEFTLLKTEDIEIGQRDSIPDPPLLELESMKLSGETDMNDRILMFIHTFTDKMQQLRLKVGDATFTLQAERYDSTGAYKKFYAAEVSNGFYIYTIHNSYVMFTFEVGTHPEDGDYLIVNYYFHHSSKPPTTYYTDGDFLRMVAWFGHWFQVSTVMINADFSFCIGKKVLASGNYCIDFYQYLKNNTKRFSDTDIKVFELVERFGYSALDKMKEVSPEIILRKHDPDELYPLWKKVYSDFKERKNTLADFYIWLVDHYCFLVEHLVKKMHRLYSNDNPFDFPYYQFEPSVYLYNRRMIDTLPHKKPSASEKITVGSMNIRKNTYRTIRE